MNSFNHLKLLILSFLIGTFLLFIGSLLFMHETTHRWILLGIYTWSGGIFIIYKTFRLLKDTQYGTYKKQ